MAAGSVHPSDGQERSEAGQGPRSTFSAAICGPVHAGLRPVGQSRLVPPTTDQIPKRSESQALVTTATATETATTTVTKNVATAKQNGQQRLEKQQASRRCTAKKGQCQTGANGDRAVVYAVSARSPGVEKTSSARRTSAAEAKQQQQQETDRGW